MSSTISPSPVDDLLSYSFFEDQRKKNADDEEYVILTSDEYQRFQEPGPFFLATACEYISNDQWKCY